MFTQKAEKMAREERKRLLVHMPLRHSELGSSGLFHAIIINFIARIRMAEVTGSLGPLFYYDKSLFLKILRSSLGSENVLKTFLRVQ